MKGAIFAASAALVGAAAASHQGHAGFHNRRGVYGSGMPLWTASSAEVCTVYTSTYTGEGGWVPKPTTYAANTTVYMTPSPLPMTSTSAAIPMIPVPTPEVTICPTPGTYTFPAKTIVVTESTTVCGAATTVVTPGEHTYGGVTTSVVTSTTVTCPYATVSTSGSVTTSIIATTTYVCPSAGTYTFGATTSSCSETKTLVYPTISTFVPGTYSHPETTVTIVKTSEVFVCPYATSTSTKAVHVAPTSAVVYATPSSSSAVAYVKPSSSAAVHVKPSSSAAVYVKPSSSAAAYVQPSSSAAVYVKPSSSAAVYVKPSSSAAVYVKPSSSAAVYSAPAYSAPAHSAPAKSSKAAKPSASASSYGGSPNHPTNGNQWAMTYTPYTTTGQCKTSDEVMTDIKIIKGLGFTTVRTYSTDCNGLENIGAACKEYGLLMIVGVFIKDAATFESGCDEQVSSIISWGKQGNWDLFEMVVIGNEALANGYCSAEALAAYIVKAKGELQAAGLPKSVPFTTTDVASSIIEYGSALCGAIDVMAANVQPYFTSSVVAAEAGYEVKAQLAAISAVCPEAAAKGCYNLESGWPSAGQANGKAIPGVSEQKAAIKSIVEVCGKNSVIFSFDNDSWKDAGAHGVEQSWGCAENLSF